MIPFVEDETWFFLKIAAVLLVIIAFFCFNFMVVYPSPRTYRLIQKISGPRGHIIIGNAYELATLNTENILDWLIYQINKAGRLMRLWAMGTYHVYLSEPADVQVILSTMLNITKGWEYRIMETWLYEGLLTSTGAKWQQRRKMLTPTFHFKILEENTLTLNKNSKILAQKLLETNGESIDIENFIPYCTLDIIGEAAMGLTLNSQKDSLQKYVVAIRKITDMTIHRIIRLTFYNQWLYYLTKYGIQFWRTRRYLQKFSYKVINDRKQQFVETLEDDTQIIEKKGKKRRAFLDLLLEIESQDKGVLTDQDIREEVDTFMFEGHDTTSTAISFLLFLLATHPDVQQNVYEELSDIFNDSDRDVKMSDLSKMVYLDKVIKETLRLYPSVPHISRLLDHEVVLDDGTILPKGTNVVAHIVSVHHNPNHWPDPEKFDPERFSEEECLKRHPYAYIPFSAGPRNCIGQKFAMMELKIVISNLIRKLQCFPVTTREDFKLTNKLILRPSVPIFMRFVPRK